MPLSPSSTAPHHLPADGLQRAVDRVWLVFLGAAILVGGYLWPSLSWAASNDIQSVICGVALGLKNGAGPVIGTIAVAVLGVGALLGKTSWTLALTTVIGITIMVGADSILTMLFPGHTYCATGMSAIKLTELNLALCQIASNLTGSNGTLAAKVLSVVAINILAYSAFFGRVSWGVAVTLSIAIATIFGAVSIMHAVYGGNGPETVCGTVLSNNVHSTPIVPTRLPTRPPTRLPTTPPPLPPIPPAGPR